ncbi:MAG TPA: hypothetical protein VNN25_20835 [Thermoanaerobaculia bacterium]|nr:hypothetical protein [Thermoanaerobaculia bacterium]
MAPTVLEQQLLLKGCLEGDPKKLAEFEDRSYLRTIRRVVRKDLETRLDKENVDHAINLALQAVYRGWKKVPSNGELRERIRSYALAVAEKYYKEWTDQLLRKKP